SPGKHLPPAERPRGRGRRAAPPSASDTPQSHTGARRPSPAPERSAGPRGGWRPKRPHRPAACDPGCTCRDGGAVPRKVTSKRWGADDNGHFRAVGAGPGSGGHGVVGQAAGQVPGPVAPRVVVLQDRGDVLVTEDD